jgi:hypothetical protein
MKYLYLLVGLLSFFVLSMTFDLTDQQRIVLMFKLGIKDIQTLQIFLSGIVGMSFSLGFSLKPTQAPVQTENSTFDFHLVPDEVNPDQQMVDAIDRVLNINPQMASHPWLAKYWYARTDQEKVSWVSERRSWLEREMRCAPTSVAVLNALLQADKDFSRKRVV